MTLLNEANSYMTNLGEKFRI